MDWATVLYSSLAACLEKDQPPPLLSIVNLRRIVRVHRYDEHMGATVSATVPGDWVLTFAWITVYIGDVSFSRSFTARWSAQQQQLPG